MPEAYYPHVTGTDAERDAVMGAYAAACDNTLRFYAAFARTEAQAEDVLRLTDAVRAQYEK